jgi:hypothetical protein
MSWNEAFDGTCVGIERVAHTVRTVVALMTVWTVQVWLTGLERCRPGAWRIRRLTQEGAISCWSDSHGGCARV